jgi:hypothetical protein
MLALSALHLSCSSDSSAAAGAMDGTWDFTVSDSSEQASGTVQIDSQKLLVTLIDSSEGSKLTRYVYDPQTGQSTQTTLDCVRALKRTNATLLVSADGASMTINTSDVRQYSGPECMMAGLSTEVRTSTGTAFILRRNSTESSSFGSYGGRWATIVNGTQCSLDILGTSFSLICNSKKPYGLNGTGDPSSISAQDTDSVQFAAHHR